MTIVTLLLAVLCMMFLPGCSPGEQPPDPLASTRITPQPAPPDLTGCTRIEVKYYPSTRWALGAGGNSILNSDESHYVDSLDKIVVDDPNRIKDLAEHLRSGTYEGSGYGLEMERNVDVVCYRGRERLLSFAQYHWTICTQDGHWFRYKSDPTPNTDPPRLRALYLRGDCAIKLYRIGSQWRIMAREGIAWPASSEWSDVFFRRRMTSPSLIITDYAKAVKSIGEKFTCPSAGGGKCHYAMNPTCKPGSPVDMVLLFETKAGWNQHGGPELFTCDNHDPKGGCVLLNDGTVKFVRTEEELMRLRWK